jgi:hypothetical protein
MGLNRDNVFSSLQFNVAPDDAIRKGQEDWEGLELDNLNYVLVCVGDNLLVKDVNTINIYEILYFLLHGTLPPK